MEQIINQVGLHKGGSTFVLEPYAGWLTHIILIMMLCLSGMLLPSSYSMLHAEGTAMLISDDRMVADSWMWIFSDEMGLKVDRVTNCYGCRLKSEKGLSDDVARILSNPNLGTQHPDVILLQLGCNDSLDADASLDSYALSLFDFPSGKVCNSSGGNVKHKKIAVSKDDRRVLCDDFAGAFYKIISYIRRTSPDSRIFLLPPVRYGGNATSADSARNEQVSLAAQLFCVPFVDAAEDLKGYSFIWNHTKHQLGNMLLIGDSYCFTRKWTGELEKIANVRLTNLGKTSATLKERKNHTNTLGAQLNRIPVGYNPDIILLEGGINDDADTERVVANYPEHVANLRRTNFAGALAYLVKVLRGRFPNARIYAVTPGGLYYGHTDRPFDFIVKANQIRRAAAIIGIPTIDWDREGRLSFVFNNSKGTGTGSESSPFIYNVPSNETGDLLHPNQRGGRFLAENAVARILSN